VRVAVIGAAGYAGGELLRLLLSHPDVTDWVATSRSQAGKPVGDVHPQLRALTDRPFEALDPVEAARGRDVVFLALEHGESSKVAPALFEAGAGLVIDIAADFRVADPALHAKYYGAHPSPDLLPRFRYGLADVEGSRLRGATAIAAPGCFATAAQLALYPLAGIADLAPSLFAVTGSSGAGVHPRPTTHHPARAHNLFAYSVMGHRHEAEVLSSWRRWTGREDAAARLMAHSGPFVRGIHLTLHARAGRAGKAGKAGMAGMAGMAGGAPELFRAAYAGRPFVRILDQPPELTHVVGTNEAHIHAASSPDGGEIQVMIAIDNLVKGAGGQAVQAMNLALGIDETRGLVGGGIFPC
jgi:N-acetyl-gamma-glutamyl-phosphate reductase common form